MTVNIQSSRWQRLRANVLAKAATNHTPCYLCGQPIDYTLTGRKPAAPSVDHLHPLATGGELLNPDNLAPVHLGCNSRRGAKQQARMRQQQTRRW